MTEAATRIAPNGLERSGKDENLQLQVIVQSSSHVDLGCMSTLGVYSNVGFFIWGWGALISSQSASRVRVLYECCIVRSRHVTRELVWVKRVGGGGRARFCNQSDRGWQSSRHSLPFLYCCCDWPLSCRGRHRILRRSRLIKWFSARKTIPRPSRYGTSCLNPVWKTTRVLQVTRVWSLYRLRVE